MKRPSRAAVRSRTPILSLCMIVKDEAHCLRRCLDSVQRFVDEIVIVDTGSQDGTVEIAREFGARIFHHPWENDFSKHRNQSLSYAAGEWILQLDADEELFAQDGEVLRDTIRRPAADYYHCRFFDIKQNGDVHGVFYLIRLFRNGMGMRYERRVHNQLRTAGDGSHCRIRIRHYGYDLPPERMEAKHRRTATLLEEMIAADPDDAYSVYQLSASHSMRRDFGQAVAWGERALDLMRRSDRKDSFFQTVFYTVAQGYAALGRVDEAERVCREALERFPLHLDIGHLLADLYFRKRETGLYMEAAHRCLRIHEALEREPSLLGSAYCHSLGRRHEILFGLACAHFVGRHLDQADALFRASYEDSGKRPDRAEGVCRIYLHQGMDESALRWLRLACTADSPGSPSNRVLKNTRIGQAVQKRSEARRANTEERGVDRKPSRDGVCRATPQMSVFQQPTKTDLGRLAYDAAETFGLRGKWLLAGQALEIAVNLLPDQFEPARFRRLFPEKT